MRRTLVALSLLIGLAFGASSVPSPSSQAGVKYATSAEAKSVSTVTIDKATDSFDAPTSTIVLPPKAPRRGALVVFSVAPLKDAPKELIKYTYIWDVNPDPGGVFLPGDGSEGAFASGQVGDPTQYKLTLTSNFAFVDANNKLTLKSTKTIAYVDIDDDGVIPPKPKPKPDPDKPVPPVPDPDNPVPPAPVVIPDGQYKLGQFAYDLTKSLPGSERAALAVELHRLSGLISAGAATPAPNPGIRSKAQLVSESAQGFTRVLGTSLPAWQSALDQIAKRMDSLKVATLPECQTAYNELATGLEAK